jgi:hypothetical protein
VSVKPTDANQLQPTDTESFASFDKTAVDVGCCYFFRNIGELPFLGVGSLGTFGFMLLLSLGTIDSTCCWLQQSLYRRTLKTVKTAVIGMTMDNHSGTVCKRPHSLFSCGVDITWALGSSLVSSPTLSMALQGLVCPVEV